MADPRLEARLSAALAVYARADLSVIDRYARRQESALGARLFPSPPGRSCSCGCGKPLGPRRIRWASGECVQAASDVIRIVTGDAGLVRMFLHWRDGGRCAACGRGYAWEADHILPVIQGGGGCWLDNLQTLCLTCHREKTAAMLRRAPDPAQLGLAGVGP